MPTSEAYESGKNGLLGEKQMPTLRVHRNLQDCFLNFLCGFNVPKVGLRVVRPTAQVLTHCTSNFSLVSVAGYATISFIEVYMQLIRRSPEKQLKSTQKHVKNSTSILTNLFLTLEINLVRWDTEDCPFDAPKPLIKVWSNSSETIQKESVWKHFTSIRSTRPLVPPKRFV